MLQDDFESEQSTIRKVHLPWMKTPDAKRLSAVIKKAVQQSECVFGPKWDPTKCYFHLTIQIDKELFGFDMVPYCNVMEGSS